MITKEAKLQFGNILNELGKALDPTETQIKDAKSRYKAIANLLADEQSPLANFSPEIKPQGSFYIGTMIKPISEECELDFDLILLLKGKPINWTQYDLKKSVGEILKADKTYRNMLEIPDGRRCWRIDYSGNSKFHMDILPCVVDKNLSLLEKSGMINQEDVDHFAVRITDTNNENYNTEINYKLWPKSNPKGYAEWFRNMMKIRFEEMKKSAKMKFEIEDVPDYKIKTPLQRAVQILKRHRDIMFLNDDDRPISIIITTLAAHAYNQEDNIYDALVNIIENMPKYIEEIYETNKGKNVLWVRNPVNREENFADKWEDTPKKKINFYKWLEVVKEDLMYAIGLRGLDDIQITIEKSFGKRATNEAFQNIAENQRSLRENGKIFMDPKTGFLGSIGEQVKNHNFYGKEEE